MSVILGLSGFYHDSSACLLVDGEIKIAVQEERFTRIKHDPSFPTKCIEYILSQIDSNTKIDFVVFYEKPFLKFERLLETYVANSPYGFKQFVRAMPIWMREKLFLKNVLLNEINKHFKINKNQLLFSNHHLSHAASAFFPSPYEKSLILTIDGVGEWSTTAISLGKKNQIIQKEVLEFPHSLGLLYSAFTYYLGFKVNSGEYKIMGLAPYGEPKYFDLIKNNIVDIKNDGSFRINLKYFNYSTGLEMINKKFEKIFNHKRRIPEDENIYQFHMDVASSIQKVTEFIIIKICKYFKEKYDCDTLCLAGGVALNCVANGAIMKNKIFKNIWIQPASGDAGGSLGAALSVHHMYENNQRQINSNDSMKNSLLGPSYDNEIIKSFLINKDIAFKEYSYNKLVDETAKLISKKNIIGWFQGRMEFGPRSLGARSILADPQVADMQKKLNLKIKYRESFRPFAPAILLEELNNWFELKVSSPYMLLVDKVKESHLKKNTKDLNIFGIDKLNQVRSTIPSVTHVDNSARIQTVNKTHKIFYDLLTAFYKLTKCPILINTSFNIRGEPIVCTLDDAYNCFMGTDMDYLVLGNFILSKKDQNTENIKDYREKFKLD